MAPAAPISTGSGTIGRRGLPRPMLKKYAGKVHRPRGQWTAVPPRKWPAPPSSRRRNLIRLRFAEPPPSPTTGITDRLTPIAAK